MLFRRSTPFLHERTVTTRLVEQAFARELWSPLLVPGTADRIHVEQRPLSLVPAINKQTAERAARRPAADCHLLGSRYLPRRPLDPALAPAPLATSPFLLSAVARNPLAAYLPHCCHASRPAASEPLVQLPVADHPSFPTRRYVHCLELIAPFVRGPFIRPRQSVDHRCPVWQPALSPANGLSPLKRCIIIPYG